MAVTQSDIRWAASQLASDAEICTMYGLKPDQLERWRPLIEAARTKALVYLKFKRAGAQAKRAPKHDSR